MTSRTIVRPDGVWSAQPSCLHSSACPARTSWPTLSSLGASGMTTASTSLCKPGTRAAASPWAATGPFAVSTRMFVRRILLTAEEGGHTCTLAPVSTTHPGVRRAATAAALAFRRSLALWFRVGLVSAAACAETFSSLCPEHRLSATRARRAAAYLHAVGTDGPAAHAPPVLVWAGRTLYRCAGPGGATARRGSPGAFRGRPPSRFLASGPWVPAARPPAP